MFKIEFLGFEPKSADTTGYNAQDYLPGWQEERFESEAAAAAYIAEEHLGPDCDGVTAKFGVEPTE